MSLKYKYAACCLAIKNDFCLEESIQELFTQGVSQVLIVSPRTYWSTGEAQSVSDLLELKAIADRTGALLHSFQIHREDKPDNYSALYTEAGYRNYGVKCLTRDTSVDYVLTVDADEFWLPGTLDHIDSLAENGSIAIELPGIPVIGVPGLPVEGAKDSILVATAKNVNFLWGRSPEHAIRVKGTAPVLHFTATRNTLDEVIKKHRLSAHYSDPTYDFEGWIKDVIPQVKVGSKNVHMYKSPENIWPCVRAWTPDELAAIPATIRKHLAYA